MCCGTRTPDLSRVQELSWSFVGQLAGRICLEQDEDSPWATGYNRETLL